MPVMTQALASAELAEKKPLSTYVDTETIEALKRLALEKEWSVSQYIRRVIQEHVERQAPKKRPKN